MFGALFPCFWILNLSEFLTKFSIWKAKFFSFLLIFRNVELDKLDYIFQLNFQLSESSMRDTEIFIMYTLENSRNVTNYFSNFLSLRKKDLLSSNFATLLRSVFNFEHIADFWIGELQNVKNLNLYSCRQTHSIH